MLGPRLLLAAAGLLTASMLPLAAPAGAGLQFTFEGGGWGHSVGMSQYGAYGMAREGYTWQEILTHYFTGASPAAADPALLAEPIWVGLAQEQGRVALTVVPTGTAPAAPVTFTIGGGTVVARQGQTTVIEALGGGTCRVTAPAGSITGPCSITAAWDGWEPQPTTAVELGGCSLPDWNAPGGTVWKPCRYARGTLHLRPDDNTATVNLTLQINIEDYILGISESPYAWGTTGGQAALEAQAVAARSYALHRVITRGDPASRPWCHCQLYDTTVDQFYVGWGHGTQPWLDAVAATVGRVMVHPSATMGGALIPIQAFYSSSTFGWTENSEDGFTAYVPYLRAVDDHWSTLPSVGNPRARWTQSFDADRLASLLPGLSTVTGAQVTRCSPTGAALEITFTGSGGPRAFSTRDLRSRLGLPSMQIINVGAPPSGSPACSGFAFTPLDPGGPVSLAGISVDDDALGDSAGDGDGQAECGEAVELLTTLGNQGDALRSVSATLSSADPYVTILWNRSSAFPDLPAGGRAANLDDWDLAVSAEAPAGHVARLTLRVTAANGGPWQLDVPLPLACGGAFAGVLAGPGDTTGDGIPDVAVAHARSGEPVRLQVLDGATGTVLTTVSLARAGYVPIAAVAFPSFTGSPAAELAILLAGPDRPARVVVVDAAAGRRVVSFGLARVPSYFDLAALPGPDGPTAPRLAVLLQRPNGAARAVLREAATGERLGGVGFGKSLAPVALTGFSGPDGDALLALLGNRADGSMQTVVRRAADRTLVVALPPAAGLAAAGGTGVLPAGGNTRLVAVGTATDTRPVQLVATDPAGGTTAAFPVPGLSSVRDVAALAIGGIGTTPLVAVLGQAVNGIGRVVIIDPLVGSVLGAIDLPAGYEAHDVASLLHARFAVLGLTGPGEPRVMAWQVGTGTALASFPLP